MGFNPIAIEKKEPVTLTKFNFSQILKVFEFFKKKKPIEKEHEIASLPANDKVLKSYQEEAQEGLPYLIEFMNSHKKDDELFRYAVKANFIEDDDSEHMWVQVNDFKDGFF